MSDLISIGRSGILAYRDALAGVSENVVNANTEGFAKRQVTLKEQASNSGPMFLYRNTASFNGVQTAQVSRVWDQYRAANAWSAGSDAAMADTRTQWYTTIEQTLDDGDAGVGTRLTAIFTTAQTLAASPGDRTQRQSFLYAVEEAAAALRTTEANLGKVGGTITSQARGLVNETNDALVALGRVNVALKTAPAGTSGRAALEDQRDALIGKISETIGVDIALDQFGSATLRLNDGGGAMLLSANSNVPSQLEMQAASDGRLAFTVSGGDTVVPVAISTGKLAALADSASLVADRRRQLDALAGDLATQLNTWNGQGLDKDGNAGGALMTGVSAATIGLATSDPDDIAAANATSANGNLLALNTMRGDNGVESRWRAISADQSLRVASAEAQAKTAGAKRDSAYTELDTISGVDLDSEAANLMRFQQAYSASAKIIQTARETLQAVLALF
jgi:flagellar hook-associated protein 1